jgi:hypothetical protein
MKFSGTDHPFPASIADGSGALVKGHEKGGYLFRSGTVKAE